jgi:hypothetical protein
VVLDRPTDPTVAAAGRGQEVANRVPALRAEDQGFGHPTISATKEEG